ncbi:unnamed protein product [Symbiodinium sp. KB8]|nr:unnamed protein product [Symbiodinium sp. KB8]
MAEWVAFSEMTAAEARRDSMSVPIDVPLRYATIPTRPVPSNLQGVELFRKHKIQCQTSRLVPLTAERCQVALKAAESYLDGLIRCYDEYWGSVGRSLHLQTLHTDMMLCWDFEAMLACNKPALPNEDAMLRLMEVFRPRMLHFRWPELSYVQRVWPQPKESKRQYLLFWTLFRRRSNRDDWRHVQAYQVLLFETPNLLEKYLTAVFQRFMSRPMSRSTPSSQLRCLVDLVWSKKSQAITVSVNAVGKLKQHGYLEEGRYVKLLRAPFRGCLFVLRTDRVECIGGQRDEALVKSVAETLIEAGKNPIIQKMQKYRRCQKGKPETGNLSVTARVRLSDAKADLSCLTWATLSALEEEDGVTMDRLLHLYKHREDEKQLYRELHAPKDLDSATRLALDKVVTQRKDGLRIDSLSGHVVRKTLPRSSMREKLADWMASPEGQAWKAQRDAL